MSASDKKKIRREQNAGPLTEKQKQARKEARSVRVYTVIFVVAVSLALVIAAGVLVNRWIQGSGILERNTVAVTLGEHKISAAELNYYFVDAVTKAYQENQSTYQYSYMGLDFTKPLNAQSVTDNSTWADFFVRLAVSDAKKNYALLDAANAEGYTLPEASKTQVDNMMNYYSQIATVFGFSNVDGYLQGMYGAGASEDTYRTYQEHLALAAAYTSDHSDGLTFTDERISEYNEEHALELNGYSYATYRLDVSSFLTGGTVGDDGSVTFSDEEKTAAVDAAQAAAETLADAKDIIAFDKAIAALEINKDKDDETSTKAEDSFTSNFSSASYYDWIVDESRQPGDTEIFPQTATSTGEDGEEVTTTTSFIVVLFQGSNDNDFPLANVRHILIGFAHEDTSNTSTTYTDEEKQTAKDKAEALYQQWQNGDATEDSFAALVKDNSTDSGSVDNGGLYEDVYPHQMVDAFNDWVFAEDRKAGDSGIVETDYGYHLMYYVGDDEMTYRTFLIQARLRSSDLTEWQTGLLDAMTVTDGDTSRLSLNMVVASSSSY